MAVDGKAKELAVACIAVAGSCAAFTDLDVRTTVSPHAGVVGSADLVQRHELPVHQWAADAAY